MVGHPGFLIRVYFSDTSHLSSGYFYASPGRSLATNVVKALLARILIPYDSNGDDWIW
jgi:hypothetical protein